MGLNTNMVQERFNLKDIVQQYIPWNAPVFVTFIPNQSTNLHFCTLWSEAVATLTYMFFCSLCNLCANEQKLKFMVYGVYMRVSITFSSIFQVEGISTVQNQCSKHIRSLNHGVWKKALKLIHAYIILTTFSLCG